METSLLHKLDVVERIARIARILVVGAFVCAVLFVIKKEIPLYRQALDAQVKTQADLTRGLVKDVEGEVLKTIHAELADTRTTFGESRDAVIEVVDKKFDATKSDVIKLVNDKFDSTQKGLFDRADAVGNGLDVKVVLLNGQLTTLNANIDKQLTAVNTSIASVTTPANLALVDFDKTSSMLFDCKANPHQCLGPKIVGTLGATEKAMGQFEIGMKEFPAISKNVTGITGDVHAFTYRWTHPTFVDRLFQVAGGAATVVVNQVKK